MLKVLMLLLMAPQSMQLQQSGRVRHFINLTNGLEALDALRAWEVDMNQINFVRIQSSHCEANAFYSVLENLDHNLLFHLATGARCLVYDLGSRQTKWPHQDGLEAKKIPRALWWGVEWSRYALGKVWKIDTEKPTLRGYSTVKLFDEKLNAMPKALYKKLKYYRKFDPQIVDLVPVYCKGGTDNDGNDRAYARMVDDWCQALSSQEESSQRDFSLPPGFIEFRSTDYAGVGRSSGRGE